MVAPSAILDVVVIGGGLSGLSVAHRLHHRCAGLKWTLLEARSVLGGRLANDENGIDMGGTWIWSQPHVQALIRDLQIRHALDTFPQPDDPSSTRIRGGAVKLPLLLARELPDDSIRLDTPVKSCTREGSLVRIDTTTGDSLWARKVVLAAPPRILQMIDYEPALSPSKQSAWSASHTWMAGVTKVALIYKEHFWKRHSNMGLPGSPAFQVYDSGTAEKPALTAFALAPARASDATLATQVAHQLARVWEYFGEREASQKVTQFDAFSVKRWPIESYLSEDPEPTQIHPHPMPVAALATPEWDGLLEFAGSESDQRDPGVMEGAIGAAVRVVDALEDWWEQVPKDEL